MQSTNSKVLREVISDFLDCLDYDIWKAYFFEPEDGDEEAQEESLVELEHVLFQSLKKHHILD